MAGDQVACRVTAEPAIACCEDGAVGALHLEEAIRQREVKLVAGLADDSGAEVSGEVRDERARANLADDLLDASRDGRRDRGLLRKENIRERLLGGEFALEPGGVGVRNVVGEDILVPPGGFHAGEGAVETLDHANVLRLRQ